MVMLIDWGEDVNLLKEISGAVMAVQAVVLVVCGVERSISNKSRLRYRVREKVWMGRMWGRALP